jgi:hypothetical protein
MKRLVSLCAVFLVGSLAYNAQALLITAGTTSALATGNQTSQSQIEAYIQSNYGPLNLLYVQNKGGLEGGSFAGSYTTTFGDPLLTDEDFTITYNGGPSINSNPVYLLVKDGNAVPAWYFYDISGWNGTEVIQGQNFWPNKGGISHVSIYGNHSPVPDGGMTAAMLGLGLLGVGFLGRRKA